MPVNKTSPSKKKHYEQYKQNHTREKNKIRRLKKLLTLQPNNMELIKQIENLKEIINKKVRTFVLIQNNLLDNR